MKILSIKNLTDGLKSVIKRFPFEVLFALTGTIAGIVLIELSDLQRNAESWCTRGIMMANLGLLLSLATSLYTESKKTTTFNTFILKGIAALFAVCLIFILDPFYEEADRIRFFLLSLAFHLLVAFAAFTAKGHVQGFWQFNKALFLRFLTGVLYSVVLFAGISAALGAMNFLFNFKFEWDTFVILWTLIVGLFNTIFVLGGVPAQFETLDKDDSYPKGLKIFTQYVLIPLATIYVLILLSYEIKILLQWNLPKGMVSNLILCYAVYGILSILLVYPIRDKEENKWIKTYARSFYFLLVPLIILLLLAVGARVFKYGITEWRYFLIVLAGWLLFITIYFLTSKKQNIKLIPMSLCILTLLTVYGPQSSFSVARYSQQRVLVNIFKKNNAFKGGKLQPVNSGKIDKKEANRAVATLNYLVNHHDLKSLQPYFNVNLSRISDSLGKQMGKWNKNTVVERYELRNMKLEWVKNYLHLSKFGGYDNSYGEAELDSVSSTGMMYFDVGDTDFIDVKGFDYYLDKSAYTKGPSTIVKDNIRFTYKDGRGNAALIINQDTLNFPLKARVNQLLKDDKAMDAYRDKSGNANNRYSVPQAKFDTWKETAHYKVLFKVGFFNCDVNAKKQTDSISIVDACFLIKVKK